MRLFFVMMVAIIAISDCFGEPLVKMGSGTLRIGTVTKIVDGDTVDVEYAPGSSTRVRLLGVNTPETAGHDGRTIDDPYAAAALNATKGLLNKGVSLLISNDKDQQQDPYNRTLAVIILPDNDVFNARLLSNGLATRCFIDNDVINYPEWEKLEVDARKQGLGVWANMGSNGVIINELHPKPKGTGSELEFVELFNSSDKAVDLSGWSFGKDENTTIPDGTTIAPYNYLLLSVAIPNDFRVLYSIISDNIPIIQAEADKYGNRYLLPNAATPPQNLVVHLKDARHGYQDSITYNLKWDNKGADGTGYTLERVSPIRMNVGDSLVGGEDDENWGTSTVLGGTPGRFNSIGTITAIYLEITLLDKPMLGKAAGIRIQAMGGDSQLLTNYQGTITLTAEGRGSIPTAIVMMNGVATTSVAFSGLGGLRITARDTAWNDRCGMKEFEPVLLGDFGQKGSTNPDNLINFNDLMWFSYYWNTKDTRADLGSAQCTGGVPALISPLDSNVDISDLMIFTSMWNWWNR